MKQKFSLLVDTQAGAENGCCQDRWARLVALVAKAALAEEGGRVTVTAKWGAAGSKGDP